MSVYIAMERVSKKIKHKEVLNDINLSLEKGKIYGITGHNGSGKTMLLRLILGFIKPTSGKVVFQEKQPVTFGAIIENPGFILEHSGYKNLKLLASIQNIIGDKEITESMLAVGLDPENKKSVKTYSLGMRQKLAIAQAIMESPDVLVLDEPTNGLDKNSVVEIRNLLKDIHKKNGTTIIMTSHNQEDISALCEEVIEMENGFLRNTKSAVN